MLNNFFVAINALENGCFFIAYKSSQNPYMKWL